MALRINPRRPHLAAAALLALWLAACAGGPSHPLAQHDAFRQGELANRQARAALARGELSSARQLTEQARQAQDLAGAAAASQALGDARAAREYRQRAEAVNAAIRAAAGR